MDCFYDHHDTTSIEELDDPSAVLVFARARRAAADRAEADVMTAAVIWAEQHPPESIDDAATWLAAGGGDTGLTLAGPGAPLWRSSASPGSPWPSAAPPTPVGR